jgi:predicted acylesterase/phospholipase RssA
MNLQENGIKLDTHRGASQRVLVLQGGGSLGAYEAGVYKTLYQNINEQIDKDDNVFDIIAGTSIGAINAALLVNHILESRKKGKSRNESWEGSDEMLEHFWKEDTSTTMWKIPTMKIGGNMVIFFPQPLVRLLEDTIQSNSHWQQEQKMYISHCLQKWILNSLTL